MSSEEMDAHLQDYLGLCNKCREDKQHADTFKERIEELQKEE